MKSPHVYEHNGAQTTNEAGFESLLPNRTKMVKELQSKYRDAEIS
eukprot:CAMPEP_0198328718 /NCGR_PEP_ID=MMETSP1450-20131203/15648_1 /TAXON_ID=753684 ORGANISM="Madagascaria erythrocladiodes, Strain CCMP3234" /NCGR_SAMPLE_ID=MMETSP1450 /ASSEMBLY_ACC=CAM_ASM_001115 /LENGTH=44 /DNA_ID= /DNA_START= /DNA_END= /DNA_ORIENTATION=